ncbi:MAG: hypothetical protein HYV07_15360 [Deltaproteobacteria bacterium]|nr:hypothetical protein [Deltaproteobacteria bacterium]
MPIRRRANTTAPSTTTTPTTTTTTTEVDGYKLDDAAVRELSLRAREEGKVFSLASLTAAAKPFDDGDKFLMRSELEHAYAAIAPTRLPAQRGERAVPSVLSALHRAWSSHKAQLDRPAAQVPEGFARVIVESFGGVMSEEETFASVYVATASTKRLGKTTEVYFEIKKLGLPTQLHGPYSIDAMGISTSDVPPSFVEDGKATDLLRKLPSQKALRKSPLRMKTFDFDATGNDDVALYLDASKLQAMRWSTAQRDEVDKLAAYKSFGSQTPAVNSWLRDSPRGKHVSVTLLDQAFERAVPLPKGLLLFRGIAADKIQGKRRDVITDPAYLSTSLDPGIARMFTDNAGRDSGAQKVLMVIEVGEGTKALVTGNKGETEIVLHRSTKLRVIEEKRERGYLLLRVTTDR